MALSSDSLVGQRMAVSFGIEVYHGLVDSAVEVIRTVERLMCEVMPLQVAPENLDVVQLRRVFRQPLDRGAAQRTAVSGRCAFLSASQPRLRDAAASSWGGPPPARTGPPRPRPGRARP